MNISDEFSDRVENLFPPAPSVNGHATTKERAYTIEEAERLSGLDCRGMIPTSHGIRNADFMKCQIGRLHINRDGEQIFELVACGESWNQALHMLSARGKIIRN